MGVGFWRLLQVGLNLRLRKPVLCHLRLVSQKDVGFDRGTVVWIVELAREARFGRTCFGWTPGSFLLDDASYVYPGRYSVVISSGSALAATLRM
jgi:hypothetical protein